MSQPHRYVVDAVVSSAHTSLFLGVLSFLFSVLAGIPAVLTGLSALRAIRESGGQLPGRRRARAGVLIGIAGSMANPFLVLAAVSAVRESAAHIATGTN